MSTGYSPLRRWLREERARDHERWCVEDRCPQCDNRDVEIKPSFWGARGYGCANGHIWWQAGMQSALLASEA